MGLTGESIAAPSRRTLGYAERLLKDVTPAMFARKPFVGGTMIDCNHPAWVYGHLALYPSRVASMLGISAPAVPGTYEPLFKNGTPSTDDPTGTIFPPMAEIVSAFTAGYNAVLERIVTVPDSAFAAEVPDENYRKMFPTVGPVATFMLNNHLMMHLGQISTWRRCMGLGAA